MKSLTSAQLFAAPKRAGKAKARLERHSCGARRRSSVRPSLQRCALLPCRRGADWSGGSAGSCDGAGGDPTSLAGATAGRPRAHHLASRARDPQNDRTGAISRCGDEMMRIMLYEAAQSMLVRTAKWSWLKAW